MVCNEEQPDAALDTFMKLLIPVTNNHAHIKKKKLLHPHLIDEELNKVIVERDEAKIMANKSGCTTDWKMYCKLRNHVTKLNKKSNYTMKQR